MKLRIATWNLNTWINRRDKNISNNQLWQWADTHLSADVVIFTEAQTPPPANVIAGRWTTAHRREGFPGVSKWGTVIAARTSSQVRVEHVTSVGTESPYPLDSKFPGTFTAADLFVGEECIATVVGLHLRYRKDKAGTFISYPLDDLKAMKKDFVELFVNRQKPMIIAGDFNYEMESMPRMLTKLCPGNLSIVDPFENQQMTTFEQDWEDRYQFCLDYLFLSRVLNEKLILKRGGVDDFPSALEISDHAPLLIELDFSGL